MLGLRRLTSGRSAVILLIGMWPVRQALLYLVLSGACVAAALLASSRSARADSVQHMWLHYDYMVAPGGESFAPDPGSIRLVVDAFAAHGIELHVDEQHTALPYHALLDLGGSVNLNDPECALQGLGAGDVVSFAGLKAQYFHPTANHEWHYAIFGDLSACSGETGVATLAGDDLAVTLGARRRDGLPITPYVEGGMLMHELGHNLGLLHGGATDLQNWKANYLSVMNYRFEYGIPYASTPG